MEHQRPEPQSNSLFYRCARCIIVRPLLNMLGHLESHGNENIPTHGGVLLVSNHLSLLDPAIIGAAVSRELHYLGEDTYFHIPGIGWLLTQLNGIPIKREKPGWQSLKRVISCLKMGNALLLFPEGTRSTDGTLGTVKEGASFIIHHSNVSTIPVCLKGTDRFMPRGSKLIHPGKVSVTFGTPLDFSALKGIDERQELYQRISQQIRRAILDLQENSR